MDRGCALLQGLLSNLRPWLPWVCRVARARSADVEPLDGGAFAVVVSWDGGEHRQEFTRAHVFGPSYALSPAAWAVQRKACEHARDLVRGVLGKRGVL